MPQAATIVNDDIGEEDDLVADGHSLSDVTTGIDRRVGPDDDVRFDEDAGGDVGSRPDAGLRTDVGRLAEPPLRMLPSAMNRIDGDSDRCIGILTPEFDALSVGRRVI